MKYNILKNIYGIYEEFIKNFKTVCRIGCGDCCTCNVTITSLEGRAIIDYIGRNKISLPSALFEKREYFQPNVTVNGMAALYMEGKEAPEEENNPDWGRCPFLLDNKCLIYEIRPFMCRAQVSEHDCKKEGYSLMDPFVFTVNNLFLQYIEDIDVNGYFGNLTDILIMLLKEDNFKNLNNDFLYSGGLVIRNQKIKVLTVPPEHRIKVMPVLNKLMRAAG